VVRWDEVDSYKHLDAQIEQDTSESIIPKARRIAKQYSLNEDELEAIMLREFGPIKRKKYSEPKVFSADKKEHKPKKKLISTHKNIIIIDGYNVIYSWESLKELADFSLEKARETLMDILSDYVAFTKAEVILVFDAYLVKDGIGSDFTRDGYRVVYTKQDETADAFIERMMFELGPDYSIKVVTGDKLVQFSAVSSAILRMTAKEFEDDVRRVGNEITAFVQKLAESSKK
jgi:predicted RNA-binding protein with PIN domain